MATAASITVVQARRVVEAGDIDPESVITPGIFVDRILAEPRLAAGPKSNHITVAAF
jgi:3-oxoadipate CoA-transferase alpha subunit